MSDAPLRIGTRGSKLALVQANMVRDLLAGAHPQLAPAEITVIKTTGDRERDRPLAEIGGKGLFTKEIEEALLADRIDLAVHSMKDVPTLLPVGLVVDCLLPREDPRDALFAGAAASIADLAQGAVVGTASLRRAAQLLARRPDLKVVPFRGNVDTRLDKLAAGAVDATLLAVAGLNRLGMSDKITAVLSPEDMLPAVAQGAVGLEIRSNDTATRDLVAALDDRDAAIRVAAERACLAVLDGSCRTPIAAFAEIEAGGTEMRLRALVVLPDGSEAHRTERRGPVSEAAALGRDAGAALRAAAGPAFFAALGIG